MSAPGYQIPCFRRFAKPGLTFFNQIAWMPRMGLLLPGKQRKQLRPASRLPLFNSLFVASPGLTLFLLPSHGMRSRLPPFAVARTPPPTKPGPKFFKNRLAAKPGLTLAKNNSSRHVQDPIFNIMPSLGSGSLNYSGTTCRNPDIGSLMTSLCQTWAYFLKTKLASLPSLGFHLLKNK